MPSLLASSAARGSLLAIALLASACGVAPIDEPPSEQREADATKCTDTPPDGRYTCAQQRAWGKCNEPWMKGRCDTTCGRCSVQPASCNDLCPAPNGVTAYCEKRFMYGANWAWRNFGADFGGVSRWGQQGVSRDPGPFAAGLHEMRAAGVRVVRWWMFPRFATDGISFDADGAPSGVSKELIADVQKALELAAREDVHLMLTLFSFDNFRPTVTEYGVYQRSIRPMVVDPSKRQRLVDNLVRPVARAVESSPYKKRVVAWDVMNEPEWATSGPSLHGDPRFDPMGGLEAVSHAQMESFLQDVSAGIRAENRAPRTVGSAAIKWPRAWSGVDQEFVQVHYYDWVYEWYPYRAVTPASVGITKPVVMGEYPFQGVSAIPSRGLPARSFAEMTQDLWDVGYAGALGWAVNDPAFAWSPEQVKPLSARYSCQTAY